MGAAGICCSSSEMSAKSNTGMDIDLDKVPTRQSDMKAFEILLSESQERMLVVGKKGEEEILKSVFEKWDLECSEIGLVTNTQKVRFYKEGQLVVDIPAESLVLGGGAPVYERTYQKPAYLEEINQFNPKAIKVPKDLLEVAKKMAKLPNLLSKRWISEQYDSMVRTNTMTTNKASDAAVVRIKGTNKALALTVDCNSTYVHADPYKGAMIAVAEGARNIICSGGIPVAITNCLNFGNPYNPEVYWQFVMSIKGMGEACKRFNTPVTGGNVSFYNQSVFKNSTEPIQPTPTIGMLGILEDYKNHQSLAFQDKGDAIYMIGTPTNDINSSEYLKYFHGVKLSPAPQFELEEEFQLQQSLIKIVQQKLIKSIHDISEGGLFFALLESGFSNQLGFNIETDEIFRKDAYLFGESQSRVIVSISEDEEDLLVNYLNSNNVSFTKLGNVTSGEVLIDQQSFGSINEWKFNYETQLGTIIES
jgi:phosphoribosylformylglycinamidine synthase